MAQEPTALPSKPSNFLYKSRVNYNFLKYFFRLVIFKPAVKALLNFLIREVIKTFICHLYSSVQSDEKACFALSASSSCKVAKSHIVYLLVCGLLLCFVSEILKRLINLLSLNFFKKKEKKIESCMIHFEKISIKTIQINPWHLMK